MKARRSLESAHVSVKPSVFKDCEAFFKWEASTDVKDTLSIDDDQSYEDVVREYVRVDDSSDEMLFTVFSKETGEPIGKMFVDKYDQDNDSINICQFYIAETENRGKGYASEAIDAFLEYVFIELHLERVTIDYYTGNKAALNLYSKLGFLREGIARNGTKKNGKYYDLNIMSMLRTDFFKKREF